MTPKILFDNLRAVTIDDLQEAANDYTSVAALASEVVSMFDYLDIDQVDIDFYDTLRDCIYPAFPALSQYPATRL